MDDLYQKENSSPSEWDALTMGHCLTFLREVIKQ